jgi:hypothetical protein
MEIQRILRNVQRSFLPCMSRLGICPMKAVLLKVRSLGIPPGSTSIRHSTDHRATPGCHSRYLPSKSIVRGIELLPFYTCGSFKLPVQTSDAYGRVAGICTQPQVEMSPAQPLLFSATELFCPENPSV